MTGPLAAGLCLAAASTAALSWGFFAQHRAASRELPRLTLRRPLTSLRTLFGNPRWLVGFVVGLAGWAFYVAALRLAPLSLVQAVSAGGIGLLALLVTRARARLCGRARTGVALAVAGLLLLGLSLAGQTPGDRLAPWTVVAVWIGTSAALAGALVGLGRLVAGSGAGLGAAAGLLYSAGDVATKTAVAGGAALVFVIAVLACHGTAFALLQLGFQRGGAISTVGISTLLTNALPIAAGTLVYGERVPGGALGALRVAAFAAVVVGAALLAGGERASVDPHAAAATFEGEVSSQHPPELSIRPS